jgi:transposase
MHDMDRFPTGQDVVSSCRRVTCAKASAGKRVGTSGQQSGNAHLTWAFAEVVALCLRHNPAGQKYLARLGKKQSQGKALTILAHKLARAVYDMLKRQTAFAMDQFLHSLGSSVGEPDASLDTQG